MARDGVLGLAAFRKQLEAVSGAVAGEALATAVVAGGLILQGAAKRNLRTNAAPDNATARREGHAGTWKTGNLARSIHIGGHAQMSEVGSSTGGDIGGAVTRRDLASVDVGTDVPYGPRIEFGYVGRDSLGRYYSQASQPFLRPAVDVHGDEVLEEVRDVLADQIERAVRKHSSGG